MLKQEQVKIDYYAEIDECENIDVELKLGDPFRGNSQFTKFEDLIGWTIDNIEYDKDNSVILYISKDE